MTFKEKMQVEGIVQTFEEAAVVPGTLEFLQVKGIKSGFISFAVSSSYVAFGQEDFIQLTLKSLVYKIMVVKIEAKGPDVLIRGLIKSETKKES